MPWACNSNTEALSGRDESQRGGEVKEPEKMGRKSVSVVVEAVHCGLAPSTVLFLREGEGGGGSLICRLFFFVSAGSNEIRLIVKM